MRDGDVFTVNFKIFVEGADFLSSLGEWLLLQVIFVVFKLLLHHLLRVVVVVDNVGWKRFESGFLCGLAFFGRVGQEVAG